MNKNRKIIKTMAAGMAAATVMTAGFGMVPVSACDTGSIESAAWKVIRGDYGNGQERKDALAAAGFDYSTVQAEVNRLLGYGGSDQTEASGSESITEVARRVIRGDYGNGAARKEALANAGYDYAAVQAEVNRILGYEGAPSQGQASGSETSEASGSQETAGSGSTETDGTAQKSTHEVALDVIRGMYGNGAARKEALANAGYDYATVQAEVNRILLGDTASGSGSGETQTSDSGSQETMNGGQTEAGGSGSVETPSDSSSTGSGETTSDSGHAGSGETTTDSGSGTSETPSDSGNTDSGEETVTHNWVPETQEITHAATYKTVHHDEVSHIEHHDAVTHEEVVTPAVTKTVVDQEAYDEQVVDQPAYDETVTDTPAVTHVEHHEAVTHVVHHDATYKTVHHEAETHIVHHDAVTHNETVKVPGKELPTNTMYEDMPVGTTFGMTCWIGGTGMEQTTPDKRVWVFTKPTADSVEAEPVDGWDAFWNWIDESEAKYGIGNWTYADIVWVKAPDTTETKTVVDKEAYDETVVDKKAYDEQVVDTPAWDETVVDQEAYDETVVDKPAVTHVVHHDATYKTVHHDAVTHEEVVKPAVTRTIVDKEACDQLVIDSPAHDEEVIDQPEYTTTEATGWYICTDCGLRTQNPEA